MKKKIVLVCLSLIGFFSSSNAQVLELITIVTNKVIKAIDLKVQEMQNSVIALQNIQRQAENDLSKRKLSEIGALEQKQKELYHDYYASLKQVKPVVGNSARIQKIIEQQKQLVALYNMAIAELKPDPHLSEKEKLDFMTGAAVIVEGSYTTIRKLNEALTPNNIVATDAARLQLINQSANQMDMQYNKLLILFNRCRGVIDSRKKAALETDGLKKSYGL